MFDFDSTHRINACFVLAAVLWAGPVNAAPQGPTVQRDIAYAESPHAEQYLDFYWPARAPSATVLFIHGGSLKENGERRDAPVYREVCPRLAAAGYGCATIDYRLAPSFTWPAMPRDVVAAVVKTRELIAARGGDPGALFLFGHSSGCTLAAAVSANPTYLAEARLSDADIAGVVAMGCVLDNFDAALRRLTADDIRESFERMGEGATFGTPEDWIAANPSYHVSASTPPTLVVVAEAERFMPAILEQGARYVRRLLEARVRADLVIVPGRHYTSIADFGTAGDPTMTAVLEFISTARQR